ncbi:OmpA/MotB family protein [Stratiformator vulcanicus]|uniref:Motility protein B n=1 Tax=Stratiformator vulcanicus TaxID=2527980 RepID=A0A517QZ81_9PLAN|nr:flagellar motor protein MotB [Stratiformator vulcanicus]QDT36955.1 Motility protein B [Stratiformator vulcanicus]
MAEPDDDAPPGVPEWVVTYGDMMSLLLTFFIMLVSLSEVAADKKYRAIIESLHKQFGYPSAQPSAPGNYFPGNSFEERLPTLGSHLNDTNGNAGIRRPAVDGLDIRVYRSREGNPVPIGKPVVFPVGDESIPLDQRATIDEIAEVLAGKPNKVEIRGYAPQREDDPLPTTHLRVAYARARNVAARLEEQGIRRNRLRIVSLTELRTDEVEAAHEDDRVDVVSLDAFSGDFVGPRDR